MEARDLMMLIEFHLTKLLIETFSSEIGKNLIFEKNPYPSMNSILSTESKKHKHALNKVSIFLRRLGRRGEDEVMVEGGGGAKWNGIEFR